MISNNLLEPFFSRQLQSWPLAARNYNDLSLCHEREISVGGFPIKISLNPARIKSTTANVSKTEITERLCFLCANNRPQEQMVFTDFEDPDFEFLVNPYPICHPHFTIVSKRHIPQDRMPWESMTEAAKKLPELIFFFNGAKSGASAPDHLHYQAVNRSEMPLISLVEEKMVDSDNVVSSKEIGITYPALFYCFKGDIRKFRQYTETIEGDKLLTNPFMNAFVWAGENDNLYVIFFPRKAHRPACYSTSDSDQQYLISPGALDVAGKIITIRETDYLKLSETILTQIFEETCLQ